MFECRDVIDEHKILNLLIIFLKWLEHKKTPDQLQIKSHQNKLAHMQPLSYMKTIKKYKTIFIEDQRYKDGLNSQSSKFES